MKKQKIPYNIRHGIVMDYKKGVVRCMEAFSGLTGLEFKRWVGNKFGCVADFDKYYISVDDMVFVVENGLNLSFVKRYVAYSSDSKNQPLSMEQYHANNLHKVKSDTMVGIEVTITRRLTNVTTLVDYATNGVPDELKEASRVFSDATVTYKNFLM